MFKIINNKIYMARGETPTYVVSIKDINRAPYRISSGLGDCVISFNVKKSIWDDSYVFTLNAIITQGDNPIHTFNDVSVGNYNDIYDEGGSVVWSDTVVPDDITGDVTSSKLYKRTDLNDDVDYRYYDATLESANWVEYELLFGFTFPYEITKTFENKTYSYDIVLYSGELKDSYENVFPLNTINYKQQFLKPTDFIIGGSVGE